MLWSDFEHFRISGSIICWELFLSLTRCFRGTSSFEVCDDDGEEMGEGHDGNDSDDDDKDDNDDDDDNKDDNDDDNDIGAFRLSRERIRSNSGRMCGEGEFYTLS